LKFFKFLPAIGWFLLSLFLLCLPGGKIPRFPWLSVIYADKWIHIFLFLILYLLFARPLQKSTLGESRIKWWLNYLLIACIAYGILMEFVQKYWIPYRSFEIGDILADSMGALLGFLYIGRQFKPTPLS
jgi:VanZ family protein